MTKIAVATQQGGLEDQVSSVFGRCQTFTFVDFEGSEIKNVEVEQNQYADAMGGSGIQAAGFVANRGVEAVLVGDVGPNVTSVLNQSGVEIFSASGMKVKDAIHKYLDGDLQSISQKNPPTTSGSGRGIGRRGGGRGMGRGGGGGMGRGMGYQRPIQQPSGGQTQETQANEEDRLQKLEDRMGNLENQLNKIGDKLEDLKKR